MFKLFVECFGQYLKKSKNGFSIVFSKCNYAGGGGGKFMNNKISETSRNFLGQENATFWDTKKSRNLCGQK